MGRRGTLARYLFTPTLYPFTSSSNMAPLQLHVRIHNSHEVLVVNNTETGEQERVTVTGTNRPMDILDEPMTASLCATEELDQSLRCIQFHGTVN